MADTSKLCQLLEYQFNDLSLLTEALTHRSAGTRNNERLEFLGDGVLNFVVAAELFQLLPDSSEGDLSRLRATIVKKESLVEVAKQLSIGDYLYLGSGELKSGGFRRESILADAVEAVLGAVYQDAGFDVCRNMILHLFNDKINQTAINGPEKDAKTRLQEYLQSRRYTLPTYNVLDITGKAHQQSFLVECIIEERSIRTEGKGRSRRIAEQHAAEKALTMLEVRS